MLACILDTQNRFVVKMSGRLRLDKLSKLIESFLAMKKGHDEEPQDGDSIATDRDGSQQLYFHAPAPQGQTSLEEIEEEIQSAVPLSHVLADLDAGTETKAISAAFGQPAPSAIASDGRVEASGERQQEGEPSSDSKTRRTNRRQLVSREGTFFNDGTNPPEPPELDYVTAATLQSEPNSPVLGHRIIPIIPFEELMLIEALGTGRVTNIYKALWRRHHDPTDVVNSLANGAMVALKVAVVSSETQDTSSVDEVRREADIAAMLEHPNICDIVGIAADTE